MEHQELQHLRNAILAFYTHTSGLAKEASAYLEDFRRRSDALSWTICLELLAGATPGSPDELFGAQTLVFRSRKGWHLGGPPPGSLEALARLAGAYVERGHTKLATQMCLACAAAALTSPGIEPPSMFSTFMALATMPDGQPHLGLQVALLAALPEEVDSSAVAMPPERRAALLMNLRNPTPAGPPAQVFQFLLSVEQVSPSARLLALQAWLVLQALPWMKLAPRLSDVGTLAYKACCERPGDMVVGTEMLSTLLATHPMPDAARMILSVITHLLTEKQELVALPEGQPLIYLLVEVGTSCLGTVPLPNPLSDSPSTIINPLLACLTQAPLDQALVTSDFWTTLSSFAPTPSLPASLIDEASVSLFRALLHRCAYPPNHEHSSLAARDALLQFREEARDLYRDVACHRGPAFVGPLLDEAIAKTTQLLHSTDKDGWMEVESFLLALGALGRSLTTPSDPKTDASLAQLFDLLSHLPPHPGVLGTVAVLVSGVCDWLSQHPSSLSPALRLLLTSLSFSEHSHLSAFALRSRQDHSGAVALLKLSQTAGPFLSGVPDAKAALLDCARTMLRQEGEQVMSERSKMLLLEAAARIAAHGDGTQMGELCGELWSELSHPPHQPPQGQTQSHAHVIKCLRRLQTVGRGVSGRAGAFLHACLSHADPLGHVLNMQGQGHERSEALRLLTVMLRSLRDATDPADDAGVLEALRHCLSTWGPVLLSSHSAHPHPSLLPLIEQAYVLHDLATWQFAAPLLHNLLHASVPSVCPQHPEVARAYFALLTSLLQGGRTPAHHLRPLQSCVAQALGGLVDEVLPESLDAALRCLVTEDCESGHVVLRYVRTVVAPPLPLGDETSARLSHLLAARGAGLMMALLGAVCGAMPSNMLEDVILTLVALLRAAGVDAFLRWIEETVQNPVFPRSHVSQKAKHEFISQVDKSVRKGDVRAFKTAVKAFCGGKRKGNAQQGSASIQASA